MRLPRHSDDCPKPTDESVEDIPPDMVRLWLCRAALGPAFRPLIRSSQHRRDSNEEDIEDIRELLGLSRERSESEESLQRDQAILQELKTTLSGRADLEQGALFSNLTLLGRRIGLTRVDQQIIALRAALRLSESIYALFQGCFGSWNDSKLQRVLGTMLNASSADVAASLSDNSPLRASGLLNVSPDVEYSFAEKIGFHHGFIGALVREHKRIDTLLGQILSRAQAPKLCIGNYPHLAEEIEVTLDYLRALGSKKGRRPANILLYGPPGTGKTELAGAIVKSLGWSLYDIGTSAGANLDASAMARIRRLRLAIRALRKSRKSAILFDEVETALSEQTTIGQGKIEVKHLVNSILETAEVPMFWITNHPERLDNAFKRRFDLIIEVNEPPQSVKERILTDECQGVEVAPQWIRQQASIPHLSPALISRIANVSRLSSCGDNKRFAASFELLRDRHLDVQGKTIPAHHLQSDGGYDIESVNASLDIRTVVQKLGHCGEARCLFHGLPGSGKTAFAHELARVLDRPLHPVLGSELVSPYVGVTEQNIAHAFRQAQREQGVLLVDEADSFLRGRERARASWEITSVNEFLQQMERYRGTLVCTTNFIDSLDPAAMRRFDLKVEFSALRPTQRFRMLMMLCSRLELCILPQEERTVQKELGQLNQLTPGDFSTVFRRLRFSGVALGLAEVLAALSDEQRYKAPTAGRSIGFL